MLWPVQSTRILKYFFEMAITIISRTKILRLWDCISEKITDFVLFFLHPQFSLYLLLFLSRIVCLFCLFVRKCRFLTSASTRTTHKVISNSVVGKFFLVVQGPASQQTWFSRTYKLKMCSTWDSNCSKLQKFDFQNICVNLCIGSQS